MLLQDVVPSLNFMFLFWKIIVFFCTIPFTAKYFRFLFFFIIFHSNVVWTILHLLFLSFLHLYYKLNLYSFLTWESVSTWFISFWKQFHKSIQLWNFLQHFILFFLFLFSQWSILSISRPLPSKYVFVKLYST